MSAMPQGGGGLGDLLPSQPDPDELLSQIRELLDQYLAMGDNTPVAAEAQGLADAIDQNVGGSEDLSVPPEAGDNLGDERGMSEPVVPPENTGAGADTEPPPNTSAKTFGAANETALARLQKRNKKQGR